MRKSKYQPNYSIPLESPSVPEGKSPHKVACPTCGGSKKVNGKPCTACHGAGVITVYK